MLAEANSAGWTFFRNRCSLHQACPQPTSRFSSFIMPTSRFSSFIFSLISLAIAAASSSSSSSAILSPNMSSCHLPYLLPADETPFDCCAPSADYSPRLFSPNFSSSLIRVRRPAHTVDVAYAEKLARAYALMKALPPDDPRSFLQQANIHCAYCNEVYNQMNSTQHFQIHGSWLFFPFHRWYLFFHERILAKLLEDDDFAIPFWNYDHPDRAAIPWLYSSYNITLVDGLRDVLHTAPAPAAIDYAWDSDTRSPEKQLRENANAMFRSLIRDATSTEKFFGLPYRAGEAPPTTGFGTVEKRPHNSMHLWVGQKSQVGWKDMGSLYAAGRDPLFYAHHALIDRLWEVWKAMPNNYDFEDEDYLNSEFAFYNEDAELVRVKVGDALNTSKLGYVYEDVENKWMEAVPVRQSVGAATLKENDSVCIEGELITAPCSIVMERDVEAAKKGEYLQFRVEYAINEGNHVDIYINLPSANADTDTGCEEYFEFFIMMPAFHDGLQEYGSRATTTATYKTSDISERLEALDLSDTPSVVVTLVPRPHNASTAYLSFIHASIVVDYVDVRNYISIS